jgi:signal transduction histidine kinase
LDELLTALDPLRALAHGTHSTVLTTLGLGGAIGSVAARSTVPVTLLELPAARADDAAETAAYYVVSEAVTNAQKHARASSLSVRARVRRGELAVEVADDGIGGAVPSAGSGLDGLRERVEEIGGSFRVVSHAGLGTRIEATIPARRR